MARKKKLVVAAAATEFAPELLIALAVIVAIVLVAIYGKNWLSKLLAPFVALWQELISLSVAQGMARSRLAARSAISATGSVAQCAR